MSACRRLRYLARNGIEIRASFAHSATSRLTATQREARDAAIDVNSDVLPVGSRLNDGLLQR